MKNKMIAVVSGLPRSGTSLMMMMLAAGGMPILTDNRRLPDVDNPKGYYEYERVKDIEHDTMWIKEAEGKAVKIISALVVHLPAGYSYQVIFMHRQMAEILASQRRMLVHRGKAPTVNDERLAEISRQHLEQVRDWLSHQPNIAVLDVNYNEILCDPHSQAERVARFVDADLDVERMAQVVDPSLYHQRHQH